MAADFWAGYLSGAIGIVIGNPMDLIKTRVQASSTAVRTPNASAAQNITPTHWTSHFERLSALARGAAAPILGYGALNALLFVTYNRSLALLNTGNIDEWPKAPFQASIWAAGALGGFATFVVSAPTELVKCRAQVSNPPRSSWQVTKDVWRADGVRGLYMGGGITSVRDAVGYGFYFWSYEMSKRFMQERYPHASKTQEAVNVLLCGGLAGVATWVSIFPLDVIKTRVQTHDLQAIHSSPQLRPLLSDQPSQSEPRAQSRPSTFRIAQEAYRQEGPGVFFRGIGICSARAFIVNAVQWAVYEWTIKLLTAA